MISSYIILVVVLIFCSTLGWLFFLYTKVVQDLTDKIKAGNLEEAKRLQIAQKFEKHNIKKQLKEDKNFLDPGDMSAQDVKDLSDTIKDFKLPKK